MNVTNFNNILGRLLRDEVIKPELHMDVVNSHLTSAQHDTSTCVTAGQTEVCVLTGGAAATVCVCGHTGRPVSGAIKTLVLVEHLAL